MCDEEPENPVRFDAWCASPALEAYLESIACNHYAGTQNAMVCSMGGQSTQFSVPQSGLYVSDGRIGSVALHRLLCANANQPFPYGWEKFVDCYITSLKSKISFPSNHALIRTKHTLT